MNSLGRILVGFLVLLGFVLVHGCGGGSDNAQIRLELQNLGRLSPGFTYSAWVERTNGDISRISNFNTDTNGSINFSGFSVFETLDSGDRIFVTLESQSDIDPNVPGNREVLSGIIADNSAVLNFPRLQDFESAQGFITVAEGNRQILAEYFNLPDVSDLGFVYQGFLVRSGAITPLRQFDFNAVPVSDTVGFDVTTAQYILSVEPDPDFSASNPYTIRPFFTNGNLIADLRQPLAKSSLTPGSPNFNFPSGVALISQ